MRKLAHYTILFSILTIAFFSAISIEVSGQRRPAMIELGDLFKKPKDFNKPADPNEFQKPTNGEFKANPLFFAAKDDKEKCQAIDLWLSSVRYEVNQAYARSSYYRQNTEFDMERVNGNEIPQFATPSFRNIFGKALPELSEKETKQIAKFLDKCTTQRWVAVHLEPLFKSPYPRQMGEWFRNFANYEAALRQAKIEAEKENYRRKYQNTVSNSGYPVAELLKETDSYRLHTSFLNGGNTEWCSANGNQAVVGLIFKANENFRVENNDQYWRLFDSEILPAVKSACPVADKVYVLNYINGFYINFDQNKVNTSPINNSPSNMLNVGVYTGSTNIRSWMGGSGSFGGGNGYSSGRRGQTTAPVITDSNATPSFASIANLRTALQGRQAKIDEEIRISREKSATAEAARQAEIARQSEARRNLLATGGFSSKGLKNEAVFENIFLGNFEALPFKRDDLITFNVLFNYYLDASADSCPITGDNKVMMTRQVCNEWVLYRNGNRTCTGWRTEPTGKYTEPALWAAKKSIDRAQAVKIMDPTTIFTELEKMVRGQTLGETSKALDFSTDIDTLFRVNSCSGQGLKRFQENLRRFAVNEKPLLEPLSSPKSEDLPTKTESEKPQTIVQKPKPTPKKTAIKKRPKSK
jgi:hypothetical protein